MSLKIDINMCRICMKTDDGMPIYSDSGILKKFRFCTQLEILKSDDLPKTICNKCVGQLEIAYDFRKQAEYSDKYLRQLITHHKEELNQSALGKQGLYYEMVLEIFRTRIKVEQDDQIEQLTDYESEEVSIVNFPPKLEEGINCKGTERLAVPIYAEIEETNIEKIPETKQIDLFTITKVTSIPKTEFKQINEFTGNESCLQEDIETLSDETQIKVKQIDEMKQKTDVKSVKISEAIEEGIQYKGSTCGVDIAKIEEIEKMPKAIFTIAKVTSIRKKEDDQTGEITDKFECIVREERSTQKGSLKRHSLVPSGKRPYKCKICGRIFTKRSSLTNHSRIHSNEPFKCKFCDKIFIHRSGLTTHMVIHTGEKPFACIVCDAHFTRNGSLKRHFLTHFGVRPYKCNLCSSRFALSYNLASHKKRHTGEKNYTCETCGSYFLSKKTLTQHISIKHEKKK